LCLVGDAAGDGAFFQAYGDDEDGVGGFGEGALSGAVQGVAQFALELAPFQDGAGGETGYEDVGDFYRSFDGAGPVLAGQEFVFCRARGSSRRRGGLRRGGGRGLGLRLHRLRKLRGVVGGGTRSLLGMPGKFLGRRSQRIGRLAGLCGGFRTGSRAPSFLLFGFRFGNQAADAGELDGLALAEGF